MCPPLRPALLRLVLRQQPARLGPVGLLRLAVLQGWLQLVWSQDPHPARVNEGRYK